MDKEIQNKNAIKYINSEMKMKSVLVVESQFHLLARKSDTIKLQQNNYLIQMGLQRKKKLTEDLSHLIKKKKAKIMSSNSKQTVIVKHL